MIVAVVCAVAVLAAAGGTAAYVVDKRDDKKTVADDGKKSPSPTASTRGPSPTPTPSSRNTGREEPTIPGWQVVANPKFGTVFEVPADWEVELADASRGYEWEDKEETTGYGSVSVNRPAYYKSDWCSYVDKKDGKQDLSLGLVGTRGEQGAKSTDEAAETRVPWWVYGGFTYPDKKTKKTGEGEAVHDEVRADRERGAGLVGEQPQDAQVRERREGDRLRLQERRGRLRELGPQRAQGRRRGGARGAGPAHPEHGPADEDRAQEDGLRVGAAESRGASGGVARGSHLRG
ncbi:conserved hypothetical protein [Streptomyces sp. SPB78]|nr:conserved hypothetical protein [Streptomyces sp. SPB78]